MTDTPENVPENGPGEDEPDEEVPPPTFDRIEESYTPNDLEKRTPDKQQDR